MSSRAEMKKAAREERLAHEHEREVAARRRNRLLILGGAFVAVVVVAAALALAGGGDDGNKDKAPSGGRDVAALFAGIPQEGIGLGSANSPYTLVEYADLQCPFCADYARNALPAVVKRYVRTGKLRLEFRLLTFVGPDSEKAGRMTFAAAEQNRLWQFIELFYENQGKENTGYVTDDFLKRIGGAVPGLDVNRALEARNSTRVTMKLGNDTEQAHRAGIDSTPSFQIAKKGEPLRPFEVSSLDADGFTAQLDKELGGR